MQSLLSVCVLGLLAGAAPPRGGQVQNHGYEAPVEPPQATVLVPGAAWATITAILAVPSFKAGHHRYLVIAAAGCSYTFTLCRWGGSTNYDAGISVWNEAATEQLGCDMSSCGLGAELTWTAPAAGVYNLRIGGIADADVPAYTLAYGFTYGTCASAPIRGATWTLVKRLFRD